jgi:hypothetical protein
MKQREIKIKCRGAKALKAQRQYAFHKKKYF